MDGLGGIIAFVVTMLLMSGVGKIGKAAKKAMDGAPQPAAPQKPAASAQPKAQPAPDPFQTLRDLLGDTDEDDSAEDEAAEEQPYAQATVPDDDREELREESPARYAQDRRGAETPTGGYVDELGNRIFDYETNTAQASSYVHTAQPAPVAEESAGDEEPYQFDLRQAVISQTILHNEYVSDWK